MHALLLSSHAFDVIIIIIIIIMMEIKVVEIHFIINVKCEEGSVKSEE